MHGLGLKAITSEYKFYQTELLTEVKTPSAVIQVIMPLQNDFKIENCNRKH